MTSFEMRKFRKPCMIKEECVSPQCCLPMMTMIGFWVFSYDADTFFVLFVIFIRGMSMLPLEGPSESNLINL